MNKAICMVAAIVWLAACGSKTDANEKNFGAAISQYLDRKGSLCLGVDAWPADVTEFDLRTQNSSPTGKAERMAALESLGLVRGTDTELQQKSQFGGSPRTERVRRYVLTDAAKPFEQHRTIERSGWDGRTQETRTDLCWGRMRLDKVVKWEGPMKFGDYQAARVTYHYRIEDLAGWGADPRIREAFPQTAAIMEGAGRKESAHGVKLTSEGWESTLLND